VLWSDWIQTGQKSSKSIPFPFPQAKWFAANLRTRTFVETLLCSCQNHLCNLGSLVTSKSERLLIQSHKIIFPRIGTNILQKLQAEKQKNEGTQKMTLFVKMQP
jgi:hypothetical protein